MNILITYSTNSGSTFVVARTIAESLNAKHTVTLKTATTTSVHDILKAEIIFFGSPSWDFDGKEGQPHETMLELLKRLESTSFRGKRVVAFGCGDSSYTHFCGAVDELEIWSRKKGATLLLPSLRLDEFFFHEEANIEKTKTWTKDLAKHF
jgi:flavodoxin